MKLFKIASAAFFAATALFTTGAAAQSHGVLLPITITNASANVADMSKAADNNPYTAWNAGGGPTQWIDIDLGSERVFSILRMLPMQSPAGRTIHHVWGRNNAGQWFDFGEIGEITEDNKWFEYKNTKEIPVRTIILQTTASPSWVAWREFQVYDGGDLSTSCHLSLPRGMAVYKTSTGSCPGYSSNTIFHIRDTRNLPKGAEVYVCSSYGMDGWSWIDSNGRPLYDGIQPRLGRCGYFDGGGVFRLRKDYGG